MNDQRETNYLAWLAIIVIGVACGNLISNWITASIIQAKAEIAAQEAAAALSKINQEREQEEARQAAYMQQQEAAQREQQAAQESSNRMRRQKDRIGRQLYANCEDWQKAHDQFQSETTKAELAKHCGRYERYISTGQVPR